MQDLAIITLSWSLLVEMRNDKMMLMTKQGLVTHQVGEANFGHLNICLAGSELACQSWAGLGHAPQTFSGLAGLGICWAGLAYRATIIDTPLLVILVFTHVLLPSSPLFDHPLLDKYSLAWSDMLEGGRRGQYAVVQSGGVGCNQSLPPLPAPSPLARRVMSQA